MKKRVLMWLLAYAFAGSLGSVGHASPLAEEVVCKKMADPNLASCNFKAPPNSSPTSIKVESPARRANLNQCLHIQRQAKRRPFCFYWT